MGVVTVVIMGVSRGVVVGVASATHSADLSYLHLIHNHQAIISVYINITCSSNILQRVY